VAEGAGLMAFVAGAAGGSLWATSWRTWFYGAGLWVKLALGAVISVGLVLPAMMGAVWPRLWLIAPESPIFRFRSRGISGRGGRNRAGNSRVYPSRNRRGLARALGFSRIDPGTGAMAIRRVGFGECGKDGPLARGCELAAFGGLHAHRGKVTASPGRGSSSITRNRGRDVADHGAWSGVSNVGR